MKRITTMEDIEDLNGNYIIAPSFEDIQLKNSSITFIGTNNYLFIDKDAKLENSKLTFYGDNAILIIKKTYNNTINLNINIYNNSLVYFSKNCSFNGILNIIASESKKIIIGEDCMFSFGCWIRNSDVHLIYNFENKRMNFSKDILIGDHVWIGQSASILKGSVIGSGSIIGLGSITTKRIASNTIVAGNPAQQVKEQIFWDRQSSHKFTEEDIRVSTEYSKDSTQYIFSEDDNSEEWLKFINSPLPTDLKTISSYLNTLENMNSLIIK